MYIILILRRLPSNRIVFLTSLHRLSAGALKTQNLTFNVGGNSSSWISARTTATPIASRIMAAIHDFPFHRNSIVLHVRNVDVDNTEN